MAIRDKLKAKFSSKNKASTKPSSEETKTEGYYTGRSDIEYYKPNEIPKSKYRGRVDPEHKEMLDAYSFGDAFGATRRASAALSGTFSPGGTKAFSRRASYVSNAGINTPSRSRRSSLSSDANASFSIPSSGSGSSQTRSIANAMATSDPAITSIAEDDTLSKFDTVKESNVPTIQVDKQATLTDSGITNQHIEHSQPVEELPFTPEELTQAMTRVTITPQMTARRTSVAIAAA